MQDLHTYTLLLNLVCLSLLHMKKDLFIMEKVRSNLTRKVLLTIRNTSFLRSCRVSNRNKCLELPSLEARHKAPDVRFVHKLLQFAAIFGSFNRF